MPPWTDTPWLSILCDILTLKLTFDRKKIKKKRKKEPLASLCAYLFLLWKRVTLSRSGYLLRIVQFTFGRLNETPSSSYQHACRQTDTYTNSEQRVVVYILGEPRVLHSLAGTNESFYFQLFANQHRQRTCSHWSSFSLCRLSSTLSPRLCFLSAALGGCVTRLKGSPRVGDRKIWIGEASTSEGEGINSVYRKYIACIYSRKIENRCISMLEVFWNTDTTKSQRGHAVTTWRTVSFPDKRAWRRNIKDRQVSKAGETSRAWKRLG